MSHDSLALPKGIAMQKDDISFGSTKKIFTLSIAYSLLRACSTARKIKIQYVQENLFIIKYRLIMIVLVVLVVLLVLAGLVVPWILVVPVVSVVLVVPVVIMGITKSLLIMIMKISKLLSEKCLKFNNYKIVLIFNHK